jgi:hypothetical protein
MRVPIKGLIKLLIEKRAEKEGAHYSYLMG